jgi:hypothetical protein
VNDFEDAAYRHYESAEVLHACVGHLANASHLYGISGECALKAILFQRHKGVQVPQASKLHISNSGKKSLWNHFANHPYMASSPVIISKATSFQSFFRNWSIEHRYWNGSVFDTHIGADVVNQAKGAKGLLGVLDLVQRGLI